MSNRYAHLSAEESGVIMAMQAQAASSRQIAVVLSGTSSGRPPYD